MFLTFYLPEVASIRVTISYLFQMFYCKLILVVFLSRDHGQMIAFVRFTTLTPVGFHTKIVCKTLFANKSFCPSKNVENGTFLENTTNQESGSLKIPFLFDNVCWYLKNENDSFIVFDRFILLFLPEMVSSIQSKTKLIRRRKLC